MALEEKMQVTERLTQCIVIAVIFFACNISPKPVAENAVAHYQWVKVVDSAIFKKSYNFQLFSIRDTLWAFHHDGNYFSPDGKEWTKSTLPNCIANLAFLDYVYFNNVMYGLGYFNGNIEKFNFQPLIFKSTDLRKWDTISLKSNIPPRFFYHPFIFKNKMWIAGGMDSEKNFDDLWNSADGIHWDKASDNLPFGKRNLSQVIHFKGKLFLLNNDVWSSSDGLNWQKEIDEILVGQEVFGYAAVVFDEQLWLLGCNRNGKFSSKILSSHDGKSWHEMDAPWSPRGGVAACVHNGKLYMTGGKYGGMDPSHPEFQYSNDIWYMEKVNSPLANSNAITAK